jgi:hypothetical protein
MAQQAITKMLVSDEKEAKWLNRQSVSSVGLRLFSPQGFW